MNFHWTNTKFEAFIAFKVDRSWDLFLTSISPANAYNGNQSGVVLVKTSTVPNERFGTSTACESAISPLSGLCTLINSSTSIGTVTPFISGLGAGSYMLGLYETGNPSSVSGTFLIAEVPVPATALLLLGALGIFGAASKRRRA